MKPKIPLEHAVAQALSAHGRSMTSKALAEAISTAVGLSSKTLQVHNLPALRKTSVLYDREKGFWRAPALSRAWYDRAMDTAERLRDNTIAKAHQDYVDFEERMWAMVPDEER